MKISKTLLLFPALALFALASPNEAGAQPYAGAATVDRSGKVVLRPGQSVTLSFTVEGKWLQNPKQIRDQSQPLGPTSLRISLEREGGPKGPLRFLVANPTDSTILISGSYVGRGMPVPGNFQVECKPDPNLVPQKFPFMMGEPSEIQMRGFLIMPATRLPK